MSWAIGQDEFPCRSSKVAVRDIDRDALLALSTQAVGEQSKIGSIQTLALAHLLNVIKRVGEHGVGVEEKSTHQRRLAVVNRACRREPQQRTAAGDGISCRSQERRAPGHQK